MKSLKQSLAVISIVSLCLSAQAQTEGVSIKSSVSPPHPSAMLDVDNSSKGVLIPRVALLATTNSLSPVYHPETSLLVYNTATAGLAPDNVIPGYYYFNGTAWQRLLNGSASGFLWANIGTTNDIFYNSGKVRVGASTPTPTSRLDVIEPSYNKTCYLQGNQGTLTFEGYRPSGGYVSYLTQTATGLLGNMYSHIYPDGATGISLISYGQNAAPTIAARYSEINGGSANALYVTAVNGVAIYTGSGWSGQFYFNSDGTISMSSDSLLKTHITNLPPVLSKIMQCRPVTYNWKTAPNAEANHGFIAQEIEQIFPELVTEKQARIDSTTKTVKTVNYTGFTSILVQALKEQQAQIEALKARVTALENR